MIVIIKMKNNIIKKAFIKNNIFSSVDVNNKKIESINSNDILSVFWWVSGENALKEIQRKEWLTILETPNVK